MSSAEKQEKSNKLTSWGVTKELLAHNWIDLNNTDRNKNLNPGEIYMCEFGENIGYEIGERRPVLIISDGWYSKNGTAVVIPLTKHIKKIPLYYNLLKDKYSFLEYDSCVKVDQIKNISSIRLQNNLGKIDTEDLARIKSRLKRLFKL